MGGAAAAAEVGADDAPTDDDDADDDEDGIEMRREGSAKGDGDDAEDAASFEPVVALTKCLYTDTQTRKNEDNEKAMVSYRPI